MSSADPTSAEDAAGPPGNPALELEALKAMCTGHLRADGPRGRVLPATTLAGGEKKYRHHAASAGLARGEARVPIPLSYQSMVALSPTRLSDAFVASAGSHCVASRPRLKETGLLPASPSLQPNRHSWPTSDSASPNSGVPRK